MNEEEQEFPPITIELVNISATNWIMEGTEKSELPLRMSWPGFIRIPPTSKMRVELPNGSYKLVAIRHILGCDYIDQAEQDKNKMVANIEQDNIWIQNGSAKFVCEGTGIGTYHYIRNYEGNTSNKNRPPDAEGMFREVVGVEVAQKVVGNFDLKSEAYAVLREVRQPNESGQGYFYNEEKLALMATLFDLTHLDTPEEKFAELFAIAEIKPKLIVDSVLNGKKKLLALIKKAEDLAVLGFADDRAYLTETSAVIVAYKGKPAKNTQVTKLCEFLLSMEGKPFLQQLISSVERAGTKSLERVRDTVNLLP